MRSSCEDAHRGVPPSGSRSRRGINMYNNYARSLKVQALRDAAENLLLQARAGTNPEVNNTLAERLLQRAIRIEAGEDDHTALPPDTFPEPA